MKEKITIVLNEREPEKARLAERIEGELNSRGFSAGRIELTESLLNRLAVRAPAVLITDYVLGDVSTGLDLLTHLKTKKSASKVIFFTDEPSAAVALSALRNGAVDYFLMNQAGVVGQLIDRVVSLLSESDRDSKESTSPPELPRLTDLVTESEAARKWRSAVELASISRCQLTLLTGRCGSGRRFTAEVIHSCRGHVVSPTLMDWELFDGSLHDALADHEYIILDSGNSSHTELLKSLSEVDWAKLPQAHLFIKASDPALEVAILKIMPEAAIVTVPPLHDRIDDISGVIKAHSRDISRAKASGLSPAFITKISEFEWRGEFKQLIATVRGALHIYTSDDKVELIEHTKRLAEIETVNNPPPLSNVSRVRALSTLVEAGSLRVAAIALGCSVQELRTVLAGPNE